MSSASKSKGTRKRVADLCDDSTEVVTAPQKLHDKIFADDELRHALIDPISHEVMREPVTAADGFCYDKETILAWFSDCEARRIPIVSPLTNQPISKKLVPRPPSKSVVVKLESNDESPTKKARHSSSGAASKSSAVVTSIAVDPSTDEQLSSEVFTELDRVMNLPTIEDLNLKVAQVVALGMESHGKSTLLERLIGLPLFPKDRQRCTICPIRVHLRRTPTVQIAKIFVRDLTTKAELHKASVAMDKLCQRVGDLMKAVLKLVGRAGVSSTHEIVINFGSPSMPNLDLVDLPGLVGASLGANASADDLAQKTYALAERVIQEESGHSIFLLVVDVRAQINHSRAAELVRVHGIESQTVGVFTKLDCYATEDDEDHTVMEKVCGSELLRTHGWQGCGSRKPTLDASMDREIDRLAAMTQTERALFSQPIYRKGVQKGKLGITAVRRRVVALFEDFLCHKWIPDIVEQLHNETVRLLGHHVSGCGLPMPRQRGRYDALVAKLKVELQGDDRYDVERLFAVADDAALLAALNRNMQKLQKGCAEEIQLTGDGLGEALQKYELLVTTNEYDDESSEDHEEEDEEDDTNNTKPLLQEYQYTERALKLCDAIVARLCEKVTSASFAEQLVAKIRQQDAFQADQPLDDGQYFNLARFPQVEEAIRTTLADKLAHVGQSIQAQLTTSLRDYAMSPVEGFFHATYGPLVQSDDALSCTLLWSTSAERMGDRLISMWYRSLRTLMPSQLTCPTESVRGLSFAENCEEDRMKTLKELLVCVEVVRQLENIQSTKPKLAFSKGKARESNHHSL